MDRREEMGIEENVGVFLDRLFGEMEETLEGELGIPVKIFRNI